jgi:hypothetical protein
MCVLNNAGQIVGGFVDGNVHGFLTTPVPELSSLAAPVIGRLLCARAAR